MKKSFFELCSSGRLDEAKQLIESEEYINDPEPRSQRFAKQAYIKYLEKDVVAALGSVAKSLECDQENPLANYVLARLLISMGTDDRSALYHLNKSIEKIGGGIPLLKEAFILEERVLGSDTAYTEYLRRTADMRVIRKAEKVSIATYQEYANSNPQSCVGSRKEMPYYFITPEEFGLRDDESYRKIELEDQVMLSLQNARVHAGSDAIQIANEVTIMAYAADRRFWSHINVANDPFVFGRISRTCVLSNPTDWTVFQLETAFSLVGQSSAAFGHWFPDYLGRLFYFQKFDSISQIPILVDSGMPARHYEFLDYFCKNPLILLKPGTAIDVKNLYVASPPCNLPLEYIKQNPPPPEYETPISAWVVKQYSELHRASDVTTPKKLYISRENSKWSRVENEKEVIKLLSEFGYASISIENYHASEQIKILQAATHIVLPAGSALFLLALCSVKTHILVLTGNAPHAIGSINGVYRSVGRKLNYLKGRTPTTDGTKHGDFNVNLNDLKSALGLETHPYDKVGQDR